MKIPAQNHPADPLFQNSLDLTDDLQETLTIEQKASNWQYSHEHLGRECHSRVEGSVDHEWAIQTNLIILAQIILVTAICSLLLEHARRFPFARGHIYLSWYIDKRYIVCYYIVIRYIEEQYIA
jgi:hypothetical protein